MGNKLLARACRFIYLRIFRNLAVSDQSSHQYALCDVDMRIQGPRQWQMPFLSALPCGIFAERSPAQIPTVIA